MTDTRDDLVKKLRVHAKTQRVVIPQSEIANLFDEAAAEIERLQALTAPNTPPGDGMVEATQADRRAAHDLLRIIEPTATELHHEVLLGRMDDLAHVQHFACHRQQALLAPRARIDVDENGLYRLMVSEGEDVTDIYLGSLLFIIRTALKRGVEVILPPLAPAPIEAREAYETAASMIDARAEQFERDEQGFKAKSQWELRVRAKGNAALLREVATAIRARAALQPQADRLDQGEEG